MEYNLRRSYRELEACRIIGTLYRASSQDGNIGQNSRAKAIGTLEVRDREQVSAALLAIAGSW
jgi:hypothetical protein